MMTVNDEVTTFQTRGGDNYRYIDRINALKVFHKIVKPLSHYLLMW